jgi:uncharacterized membrane protein (Fun14 family)
MRGAGMDIPALLAENIVQGFVIGLIIGLVLKMASKAVRNVLIIQFVLIKWLEARNIVVIDWNRLTYGLLGQDQFVIGQTANLIESLVEMGIFGAALVAGFLLARRISK